jgi:hypothetical protein
VNPVVELSLSLILFLPWFLILGVLFWLFPRHPQAGSARIAFNAVTLLLALVLSVAAMRWGFINATLDSGPIWRQVLATLLAYGAYLFVLGIALPLRPMVLRRRPQA